MEVLTPEGGCLSLAGVDEMRILRGPYLGFGGGGLGTPVVSYAPRPILQELTSMEIIMVDVCRCGSVVLVRKAVCLLKKESGGVPRNQKKSWAREICMQVGRSVLVLTVSSQLSCSRRLRTRKEDASQKFSRSNDRNECGSIADYYVSVKIWVALTIRDFATVSATARLSWAGAVTLMPVEGA